MLSAQLRQDTGPRRSTNCLWRSLLRVLERYFYFEVVREQDSLFRYVSKLILHHVPGRGEKASALTALKDRGIFLIDLSEDPLPGVDLSGCVDKLVRRCHELSPRRIILIKTNVYDLAYRRLKAEGLPVIDERIPFPGSGQQRRFEERFGAALQADEARDLR